MPADQTKTDALVQTLWDYHLLRHELKPADCIVALGSHDIRVAAHAGKLYLDGLAPRIVTSGYAGRLTKDIWDTTEAEAFAQVLRNLGVPEKAILIEDKSTNTSENIQFTRTLLEANGIFPKKIIAVHKPYMERRTYATFKKVWPDVELIVTSPPITFAEYPTQFRSKEEIINIVVGDLQRIKIYSERGYSIPQEIPSAVWDAYESLVAMGYTSHLVPDAI